MTKKQIILTFDDAVANHASFVAPLLKELGFGATFFICEFPPDFATNKQQYMTWEQIRSLHDMGFELGNHTLSHAGVGALSTEQFTAELDALEERFATYGIPRATSFAYPGGPGSSQVHPILKEKGYRFARTVENRPWNPALDDPYNIPSYPVHGDSTLFHQALADATPDTVPVLVYHGVPEFTHPWVNKEPHRFEEEMRFLAREGYQVLSFSRISGCSAGGEPVS